jgi:hypothetical protein
MVAHVDQEEGGIVSEPQTTDDEQPTGLWATGRARYQQGAHAGSTAYPAGVSAGVVERQGTWLSGGYRSSATRALVGMTFIAVASSAQALYGLIDVAGIVILGDVASGGGSVESLELLGTWASLLSMATAFAYLASAIAFLRWLSRAVDNVPPLTGLTPRRSPRGAIGWWFVPIAYLFIPYQIVTDTSRRLDPDRRPTGAIHIAWWLLFIAGLVQSQIAARLVTAAGADVQMIQFSMVVELMASLATAVSGILLILIIRRVERFSAARAAEIALRPLPYLGGPAHAGHVAQTLGLGGASPTADSAAEHVAVAATADGPASPPPPPA